MLDKMPKIGIGTFLQSAQEAFESVSNGLEVGYRHIDTAQIYDNEEGVGRAIMESEVSREDIFLTTKVWIDNFSPEKFLSSLQESLKKLKVDQVDLTLIHWPHKEIPLSIYLPLLQQAKAEGLTRTIGVSNFNIELLTQTLEILPSGELFTNQIEVHPFLQNKTLLKFCQEHQIPVTAYMPLARGKILEDPLLQKLSVQYKTSIPNIVLSWLLSQNIVVIPSSKNRLHLQSNLEAINIPLAQEDIKDISQLDRGERIVNPDFSPLWDL